MPHRLRDGLSWCVCNGQVVFLDLPADRYFRLAPSDNSCFQQWVGSGSESEPAPQRLIKAGLVVTSSSPRAEMGMAQAAPPSADLAEEARGEARLIDIGRGLVAQYRATSVIRRGRLAVAIAAISRESDDHRAFATDSPAAVRRIAAAFGSAPLAFRKAGQCLPRGLAAYGLCRAAGALPTFVFGVRLEPFAAHCWLQLGSDVVVGDLEQARMFTPILAVP